MIENWIKGEFDTYIKKTSITSIMIWDIREKEKIVGYQVLADTGSRLLVIARPKTKEEAINIQKRIIENL